MALPEGPRLPSLNRTFALFLAIAVLVAHMLAIHKTAVGTLAPPYEIAHVAHAGSRVVTLRSARCAPSRSAPSFG